ncbi:MAG: hypothetical protein OHK93_006311 [Ramalina farinacea]|uniref:F-box domain-containing protein n=1 Tax=Ramalina farinacea TaxID=258253 RepID=A0AA43QIA7_9LECA|nr:hypothetical protein [Ramalina farinacea]
MTLSQVASPPLPHELLEQIFDSLGQPSLHACSLTCRSWYASSIAFLYTYPLISGANFDTFVAAICPSINAHVRHNGLASLVKVLDMSHLVHNGRKSLTARLLGRMKGSLESFIAPQATFAPTTPTSINSLAALSKCHALRTLNLTLVSEAIPHSALFSSISQLHHLHTLHLPHSFASSESTSVFTYPPALRALHITGSITDSALFDLATRASFALTHTTIASTPHLSPIPITIFLSSVCDTLTSVKIGPNMRTCAMGGVLRGNPGYGEIVLPSMPSLREMSVVLVYVDWRQVKQPFSHFPQLRRITLNTDEETSGEDEMPGMVGPDKFADAVENGTMPQLRIVRVRKHLKRWTVSFGAGCSEERRRYRVGYLDALLKDKAREDRRQREGNDDTALQEVSADDLVSETEAGVIFFGPSRKT